MPIVITAVNNNMQSVIATFHIIGENKVYAKVVKQDFIIEEKVDGKLLEITEKYIEIISPLAKYKPIVDIQVDNNITY